MYLQITEKCNMTCEHCCFSCTMEGKHGTLEDIRTAIYYAASEHGNETITIGGGEPTLHPDFFEILKTCLREFDYVWFATNGSQTEKMYRIIDIMQGKDYPECDCEEEDPDQYEEYGCLCHEKMDFDMIDGSENLAVDISQDYWHDQIDYDLVNRWEQLGKHDRRFLFRNVVKYKHELSHSGRAKENGLSEEGNDCGCGDIIIKPDGELKLCGCEDSPTIGNVFIGIEDKWKTIMYENEGFQDTMCHKSITESIAA